MGQYILGLSAIMTRVAYAKIRIKLIIPIFWNFIDIDGCVWPHKSKHFIFIICLITRCLKLHSEGNLNNFKNSWNKWTLKFNACQIFIGLSAVTPQTHTKDLDAQLVL